MNKTITQLALFLLVAVCAVLCANALDTPADAADQAINNINRDLVPKASSSSSGASPRKCRRDQDCLATSSSRAQYCQFPAGQCGGANGTCRAVPNVCTQEINYVCGCNGRTFSNPCAASRVRQSIAATGRCPVVCNSNRNCRSNEYCAKSTGTCNTQGQCQPIPDVCPAIYQKVCGCDGKEYSNGCFANIARTNVARLGSCNTTCTSNNDCSADANEYCELPYGQCAGSGTCVTRPDLCTMIYDPVCGCDGQTYGSACSARSTGANIKSQGECPAN
eukprot:TRINITY_DN10145_c0_g1_i2.p1 TRINITY_DN10145_c0_g1~~TRINITY_DN10145_c0_g1_i2.p1  ORF type:complete len:315 (-),score=10.91 TRINITY_DN10145_c0_g1_i2:80-910(-)